MHPSETVADILRDSSVEGVFGGGAVWRIVGASRGIRDLKKQILNAVLSQTSAFVNYDLYPDEQLRLIRHVWVNTEKGEEPWGVPADMSAPHRFISWEIPRGTSPTELLAWLNSGDWQFWVASHFHVGLADLWRATDEDVAGWVQRWNLDLIIICFDYFTWTVGLSPDA